MIYLVATIIAIVLVVGAWAIDYYIFRRLRISRVLKHIGIPFDEAICNVRNGNGFIVIDHAIGPSQGLASPSVWWISSDLYENENYVPFSITRGDARLTDYDGLSRDLESMLMNIPEDRILHNQSIVA